MEIEIIAVCFIVSVVLLLFSGIKYLENMYLSFLCAAVGVGLIVVAVGQIRTHVGTLYSDTLYGKTYAVIARATDGEKGKGAYVLYDLINQNNRLAEFYSYPPTGYTEKITNDGVVLLTPTPSKYPPTSL